MQKNSQQQKTNKFSQKYFKLFAAISGFLAVALGAFAAHSLKNSLSSYSLEIWKTAVLYQFLHTAVILQLSYLCKPSRFLINAQSWFCLGIVLFSGSLYLLSVTGISKLGMITPIGGICLLIGWTYLMVNAVKAN
jgi:uncharacterized membrane protein YgdD (TMEM256/DUF423 family)